MAEGRLTRIDHLHNLVVLDVEDGSILHRVKLEEGAVHPMDGSPARVSLSAGVGLDAGLGRGPSFIFGGDDGWLYILDPSADPEGAGYPESLLVASLSMGTPLGELSALDVDDDGFAEILVTGKEGEAILLDAPGLDTEIEVVDTNCADPVDVDEVERSDLFCASWTFSGETPDGFVATLFDNETGAQVAPPVESVASAVRFEGLRLTLGARYEVHVQAYSGLGKEARSSLVYSSDGALVVDPLQAPELTLVLAPEQVVAGELLTIDFVLDDPSPLASYRLRILDPAQEEVYVEEALLNTAHFEDQVAWVALDSAGDPVPLGAYRVELSAEDFSGLEGQASAGFEVVEAGPEVEEAVELVEVLEPVEALEVVEVLDEAEPDLDEALEQAEVLDEAEPPDVLELDASSDASEAEVEIADAPEE